ncbi:hypothetical protein [Pelagibacterium limicola]|uniref:hypothetical protein n=1 Tax=Pelagibacterium limicola TaxID=2791022 RepID=UPI0018AF63F8|nr:hypothetical protein [Pelagibacterium limicola]
MSAVHKFALATAILLAVAAPANAQNYGPYGQNTGFDWDGFYAGVYGGGVPVGTTSWNVGIFTGVNVAIDSAVFGVEAQLGADFGPGLGLDALLLGKAGMTLGDILVYGTAGTGFVHGGFGYAVGGGGEYAFTDSMSGRVEALGLGTWGGGLSALRLTAGVAFHL